MSRSAPLQAVVALIVAILAVYAQVRDHEFVGYDDIPQVIEAPGRCRPLGAEAVLDVFSTPKHANWVPLTNLSHQLDCSLYGAEPAGYLLTNVGLHALATLLLFTALLCMTGATGPSAFVAGVFALHPLHVESVAWASGRRDLLFAVFWMGCLLAHARHAQRRSAGAYLSVVLCLVLALLSKPMAVTLPFVLLLLDYWPLRRLGNAATTRLEWPKLRSAVVEKLPLFLLVGAMAFVTLRVQAGGGNLSYGESLGASEWLANVVVSYGTYVTQTLWPSGLAVFYPFPIGGHPAWLVVAHALLLSALSVAALRTARTHPYLLVGWLWYLGTLLPVIGLVQTEMQARADRYTYVPQIGLAIALAWGVAEALPRTRRARLACTALASAALIAFAVAASLQVRHWRDSITLFRHAVTVTEDNHVAHYNLGAALGQAGQIEQGHAHQRQAQEILEREVRARAER